MGIHTHLADLPPVLLVAQKIRTEFERNGHICADASSQEKADFTVDGTVYKFSIRPRMGFFSASNTGNIAVKLTLNRLSDSQIFIKSFEGEYTLEGNQHFYVALGQALSVMIKDISTDAELVEFIKK